MKRKLFLGQHIILAVMSSSRSDSVTHFVRPFFRVLFLISLFTSIVAKVLYSYLSLSCRLQFGGCMLHVANCKFKVAGRTLQVARCRLYVEGCMLHDARCMLHVASCRLQTEDCRMQVAGCRLQVVSCRLHVAGCK